MPNTRGRLLLTPGSHHEHLRVQQMCENEHGFKVERVSGPWVPELYYFSVKCLTLRDTVEAPKLRTDPRVT
jgi:hypothetical protein